MRMGLYGPIGIRELASERKRARSAPETVSVSHWGHVVTTSVVVPAAKATEVATTFAHNALGGQFWHVPNSIRSLKLHLPVKSMSDIIWRT